MDFGPDKLHFIFSNKAEFYEQTIQKSLQSL